MARVFVTCLSHVYYYSCDVMSEPCLMTSSPAGHHTTRGCLPLGQGGAKLLWTHTNKVTDGWRLIAAIQHDNRGQPTFFHRTLNEFQWGGEPYPTEVVAGPLPLRWIQYYLASDSHGVSKAVGDEHVVPDIAFSLLQVSIEQQHCCMSACGVLSIALHVGNVL